MRMHPDFLLGRTKRDKAQPGARLRDALDRFIRHGRAGIETILRRFHSGDDKSWNAILKDFRGLDAAVADCTGGQCAEADLLVAEAVALEGRRASLESLRAELEPCSNCQALDAALSEAEQLSSAVHARLGNWNEQD